MDASTAAKALQALGHEKRLEVFQTLVQAGHDGLMIGDIQSHVDIPASTLAHHLSMLVEAGLVKQEKTGRKVYCLADYTQMETVFDFVMKECCIGFAQPQNQRG